ncbi:MAG: DUF2341 domain-containing protein, partial [Bacteroidales bacterium]|nr:DUF2341 domain-containing protein [Bacteroidales bacterium]
GAGLSIGANTLTLNGQINCGTLAGGATSNIIIGGAGTANLSAVTLNNLTINRAVTMCGNVTVGGTLTLTSGTFTVGANTLTLNGPTIAGTPSNLSTTSSSSLIFGGSSTGVLIPSSVANLNNLTINNANGVTLTGSVTVSNILTMTQGNITTGANTLILSNSTSGNLSYAAGTITGKFQRAIGSTGTQYLFPVGTVSSYNPLKITFSNLTAGQLAVQFLPDDIGVNGLPLNDAGTEIFDRQVTGYWTLTAVAPMASASYDVNLNYSGFTGVDPLARIMKRTNGGNLVLDGTHGTVLSPEITRTGMNGISTTSTDLAIGIPNPRFLTHPSDFTGCNASFSVTVSGKAPLTYQWQENNGGGFANITNGGIYSGATSSTLTITGAPMSMNGYQYRCIVTDGLGYNATSNSATLTLTVVTQGYLYSTDITLDPASGSSDLTDFPVLISITTSPDRDRLRTIANGGRLSSSNGYDIIFTDQNGSKLDHQIESYNAVTGEYIAWVRIPVLSYTSSTTIIMQYGNPAVSSNPSLESVWTTNYKGVWHLNGTDYTDATIYGNDGTQNATVSVDGRIAGGKDFNGSTSYIQVPTNGFVPNDNNQTISIWANYATTPGGNRNLISFQNAAASSAIQLGFRGGNAVAWKWAGAILVDGGAAPSINTWHYYVYTYDGTTSRLYIDGIEADNSTVAPQTAMPSEGNIGRYNNGEYIDAILDEPRFSMSPKSAGWILTEYNNQNDPAGFITLGTENSDTLLGSAGVCSTTYTLDQGYPSGGTYSGPGVTGTNFDASTAGVGTHTITYTYTDVYGCTNNVSKDIIVTAVPSAPSSTNVECCYLNIADLEASGINLRWYTDPGLTTLAGTGTPFATGQTAAGIYTYYVTQTVNGCQSASTTVSLTIFNGITINTQPQPASICPDGITNFTISASGYFLTYQWQEDGANITDGGIYSGATTPTLTLTSPGITKNGKLYRCVLSTSCGTSPVNSSTALLTIITDPTWTGAISSDWNISGNWNCGLIPGPTNSVQIPNVSNKPVLNLGAVGTVNNLTIDIGSSLTIDDNTLQIAGNITNNGTFTASAGTIEMNGSVAQTIPANTFAGNAIRNLTINNSSGVTLLGSLDITEIVSVQSGTLSSGGYLTLVSTAVQTALIDGAGAGTVSGNVTMQRYLPSGFGYKYFSSPFQAATVNEFGDDMDLGASFPAFYRYDESRTSAGWVRYDTATRVLNPMHGYAVNFGSNSAADTIDVTGVVNNGSLSRTVYNNNRTYTKGFNLVGNPYPSPINWNAASGWTKTNIDNALYYFKASATDQYGGTYSTYIAGASSDGLATNIIPSMQGVFVHVSDGTYPVTGTLAMNNSVRVTDLTHSFIKSDGSNPGSLLRLAASFADDPASKDPVVIYFDEKALNAFDGQLDALKLMNTDLKVPNLYAMSSDGKKLSISALPFSSDTLREVPLGLKTNINGIVIFRIRDIEGIFSEMGISFFDKVAGIDQNLLPDNEYSIYLAAGEYTNRFFLNLLNTSTGISENTNETDLIRIYSSHGVLKAEIKSLPGEDGILRLYNLTGQVIFMKNVHAPGYYEFNPVINDGIYIVSYISGTITSTKKIFIQNR